MEGMGLIFTPVIGRRLLCHLSMFRPMAGNSETHILLKEVVLSGTDPEKIKRGGWFRFQDRFLL